MCDSRVGPGLRAAGFQTGFADESLAGEGAAARTVQAFEEVKPRERRRGRSLAVALCGVALAACAMGQESPEPQHFGEQIDVRTGFVRVTLPGGTSAPRAEEFEVLWQRQPQKVLRVLGGAADPLEVGIAVDRSASMHAAFEPMRAAALALVDQGISESDRVFVVGFADQARLLAEGRGAAKEVLQALPASPEAGTHPTALWQSLTRALELFGNADGRAALIVVSDGCDTTGGFVRASSVARRSNDLAIPIFLLLPGRDDCRNTVCVLGAAGEWSCSPADPPRLERQLTRVGETVAVRTMTYTQNTTGSFSTAERHRFTAMIADSGGGTYTVKRPEDWPGAWRRIFDQLGRQWTIVYEPTSDDVKSEEIAVYRRADGRRKRLR